MKPSPDILVIDDEAVVLQGVARICGCEGLSVEVAASGRAGLERLAASSYRLIICDLMLGDLDGFEFLAEARRRGNHTPVIMTTGHSTLQNAVRSLQCGAIDTLPKPFTADELMAVVGRALAHAALGDCDAGALGDAPAHVHCLGQVSWAATEPVGTVLIGMHPHFARALRGIRSIDLAPPGTELLQGASCASLTSADGLPHELMCPVSGKVIEPNAEAVAHPSRIEEDAYGSGWLYRILPDDLEYSLRFLTSRLERRDPQEFPVKGDQP